MMVNARPPRIPFSPSTPARRTQAISPGMLAAFQLGYRTLSAAYCHSWPLPEEGGETFPAAGASLRAQFCRAIIRPHQPASPLRCRHLCENIL